MHEDAVKELRELAVIPEAVLRANKIVQLQKKKKYLDFSTIPLDDKKTWDLISSGFTKGIFQVEKNLGKRYCKEIEPRNINELSDVISLIRPGCLEAEFREKDDKPGEYSSITHTYIKVKNGTWEPEYIHDALEPIFRDTYSVPIYQEQIMRICSDFAGFTLKEADIMRKAVGKKKEKLMASLKQKFIDGAVNNGHDEKIAETIFGWIKDFSGYGFNKSHGVSYAFIAYKTAYAKTHYPLQFFKAMLENSEGKQDSMEEIQELVHEARYFGIQVNPPKLKNMNVDFIIGDGEITFGLGHIKGVGKTAITSLKSIVEHGTKSAWLEHATKSCDCGKKCIKLRSNVAEALIKSGSLDYLEPKRILLLAEYKLINLLTPREQKWLFEHIKSNDGSTILEAYNALLESKIPNKRRKPALESKVAELNQELGGTPKRMAIAYEKHLLGIPLSGSLVDLYSNEKANIKCANFPKLKDGTSGAIGVVIEKVRKIKDKRGRWMAFLTVSDDTYIIDTVVVFASVFDKLAWIIEEGRPVLITGRKNNGSLLVKSIDHL
jgi:DNA polymerase-3 subunit alpha